MGLYKEREQLKERYNEEYAEYLAAEEPFQKKIEDLEERIRIIQGDRNRACHDAWSKAWRTRRKLKDIDEKIKAQLAEETQGKVDQIMKEAEEKLGKYEKEPEE